MFDETETVKAHALHPRHIERQFIVQKELMARHASVEEVDALISERDRQFRILLKVFTMQADASKYVSDEVKWPADWRQALKERFAPAWFLRRWPVKYAKKRIEHTLEAHIVVPDVLVDRDVFYLYEFDGQPFNPEER